MFWWIEAVEVIEATEVIEAVEVIEARFLMAGKSPTNQSASSFWIFEAKEAIEVIEASDVIMSVEVMKATEVFKTI